jgi:hypothetical protein
MTYFPHNPFRRSAAPAATPPGSVRQRLTRDILWNQPVFKAPVLTNPRIALDPLPFIASRLTQSRRGS